MCFVTGGETEDYSWKWCALSLTYWRGGRGLQLEVMCFVTYHLEGRQRITVGNDVLCHRLEGRQRIIIGSDVLCHLPTGGEAEDYNWKWCALSPTGGETEDYNWKWCALSLTDWRAGRVLQYFTTACLCFLALVFTVVIIDLKWMRALRLVLTFGRASVPNFRWVAG